MSETRIGNRKPALTYDPYDLSLFPLVPFFLKKIMGQLDPGQAAYICDH